MILLLLACLTPESYLAEYSRITCENLTRCGVELGMSSVAPDLDDCLVRMEAVHTTVCRPTHFDAESAQSCLAYLEDIECSEYQNPDINSGCADVCVADED
tara:strand:- start:2759 stop:3061 length:303 start_codon:yes stop_codon:yes gene_type:complete